MSNRSFYSNDWYRVEELKPRIRMNAGIRRHEFRGSLWYVVTDQATGKFHRLTPEAWLVASMLDGQRTVSEVWEAACARLGDDALTQGEVIRLLALLHQAGLLQGDVMPDVEDMLDRAAKLERKKLFFSLINPLALRFPLVDPDEFLTATLPLVRWCFSWFGALMFLGFMAYTIVLAALNWDALSANITDRVLIADNILLLLLTYPIVKALHELGHGYAVKRWGGEVHVIGIMMLVFLPVPFVDASAATEFRSKYQRAVVGAAGIFVELILAGIALTVWLNTDDGLVRACAFNVMLIGGISTLLFNGNPLLRFDGYYVLSDLIEIPNLDPRSKQFHGYLIQRYLFGVEGAENPAMARGEAKWLFFYALAAFFYRMTVVFAIIFFVATAYPLVGGFLAIWSLIIIFGLPLGKHGWFLLTNPALRRKRGRAFLVTGSVLVAMAAVLFFVRLPYATVVEGIVWSRAEAEVFATGTGRMAEVAARPNAAVEAGATLFRLRDPVLQAQRETAVARVAEMRLRLSTVAFDDQAEANVLRARLAAATEDLQHIDRQLAEMDVLAPVSGQLVVPSGQDLPDRFFRKGDLIGHVARFDDPVLIVVVPGQEADLVRSRTREVSFRFADSLDNVWPAHIVREVPEINRQLPSAALSTMGGGRISLDPGATDVPTALSRMMQFELAFDEPARVSALGGRVYVRFRYDDEAIATRVWRTLRQLLLRELNV